MLKKFIGESFFCGLDIGAQSIKASFVKTQQDGKPVLLGVYESKTRGFESSSVTDLSEFVECIHATIAGLAKKTNMKIQEVQLGLNSELIDVRRGSAVIPLLDKGNKEITRRDVKKVQEQARLLGVNLEETVLHTLSQYYKIDDVNIATNPVGLYGRKLEIHTLLVLAKNVLVKNLTKAVNQAGYDVLNLFFTSLAATEASLNEFQKKQGCAVIDAGATMTNVLIFKEGQLKYMDMIELGGDVITQSIAEKLNLTLSLAEEIKKTYAVAEDLGSRGEEEILIKRDDGYFPVKKEAIAQAVEPVVAKLILKVSQILKASGLSAEMNAGIILVGGGALLTGVPECIEKEINTPAKLGKVKAAIRRLNNAPKYAAVVGLAQLGAKQSIGHPSSVHDHAQFGASFVQKIKEFYQEYF
ncbi:MAG: cell division protein FtsA [Candidatus Omnitrophica bacterium]|nr:cell division protein FtsA [Candidatus Omnitrophota bacterium]